MLVKKRIKEQGVFPNLVRDARDFALTQGVVMRSAKIDSDNLIQHAPVALFPSLMPKILYDHILQIQPIISKLMFKVGSDTSFIQESLHDILEVDEFTRKLFDVQLQVEREGLAQPILSCINRSDYMLDKPINNQHSAATFNANLRVRQVEVNAIASAMTTHSHTIKRCHDFLMSKYNIDLSDLPGYERPANDCLDLKSDGIIAAFDSYGKSSAVVLLVNEDRSLNFGEHFIIELAVAQKRPDIKVIRRKFRDLSGNVKLGPNKELLLHSNNLEVGLVYFRYCYDPSNYNFEGAWDMRLLLERSRAIKCPSISFHVSGIKKFQQVLNSTQELERYLDSSEAANLNKVFCKFWSIENETETGREGFHLGMTDSNHLVLKPQREGGGHNIFGSDIRDFLCEITYSPDRSQYILMELINSPKEKNWLLCADDNDDDLLNKLNNPESLISELGIYGSILADHRGGLLSNRGAGYLVRSKRFGTNEGGVAAGYAGLSSLILFDHERMDSTDLYES